MTFKIRIGNISKVPDNNIRICNRRLHIYFFIIPCNWMDCIGVWVFSVFHLNYLFKFRSVSLIISHTRHIFQLAHPSGSADVPAAAGIVLLNLGLCMPKVHPSALAMTSHRCSERHFLSRKYGAAIFLCAAEYTANPYSFRFTFLLKNSPEPTKIGVNRHSTGGCKHENCRNHSCRRKAR